jgi:hypothetical protein
VGGRGEIDMHQPDSGHAHPQKTLAVIQRPLNSQEVLIVGSENQSPKYPMESTMEIAKDHLKI